VEVNSDRRQLYLAFIALAILSGPVDQTISSRFLLSSGLPTFHSLAIAGAVAGFVLLLIAAVSRQPLPNRAHWTALLTLLAPQWLSVPFGRNAPPLPWLHGIGWGTALLLSLAAPLWLGLVSAANVVRVEVPRSVIAAAILAIGAMCLVIPVDAISLTWLQAPVLVIDALLGIAVAISWVVARPRLSNCQVTSAAGAYLLLSAVGYALFACMYERGSWHGSSWHMPPLPMLAEVVTLVVSWRIWFWLLENTTLGAFSMRTLATCTASLLPGFATFGFQQWRMNAAIVISCLALAVALRSSPAEEQLLSLGLAGS
jgi:hypothetical protein